MHLAHLSGFVVNAAIAYKALSVPTQTYSIFHVFEPQLCVGAILCCARTMWSIYAKIPGNFPSYSSFQLYKP